MILIPYVQLHPGCGQAVILALPTTCYPAILLPVQLHSRTFSVLSVSSKSLLCCDVGLQLSLGA